MYYFISLFFLYCYGHHRDLHSFLHDALPIYGGAHHSRGALRLLPRPPAASGPSGEPLDDGHVRLAAAFAHGLQRSEEHTSELQSHSDLVCRLLLEKKKRKQYHIEAATKHSNE